MCLFILELPCKEYHCIMEDNSYRIYIRTFYRQSLAKKKKTVNLGNGHCNSCVLNGYVILRSHLMRKCNELHEIAREALSPPKVIYIKIRYSD